jgi:hypothetical protein
MQTHVITAATVGFYSLISSQIILKLSKGTSAFSIC